MFTKCHQYVQRTTESIGSVTEMDDFSTVVQIPKENDNAARVSESSDATLG